MEPMEKCPVCWKSGKEMPLKIYQWNLKECVQMCPDVACSFPNGYYMTTQSTAEGLNVLKACVENTNCNENKNDWSSLWDRMLDDLPDLHTSPVKDEVTSNETPNSNSDYMILENWLKSDEMPIIIPNVCMVSGSPPKIDLIPDAAATEPKLEDVPELKFEDTLPTEPKLEDNKLIASLKSESIPGTQQKLKYTHVKHEPQQQNIPACIRAGIKNSVGELRGIRIAGTSSNTASKMMGKSPIVHSKSRSLKNKNLTFDKLSGFL